LYSYQFNKPYTKLVAVSMGMLTAVMYMRILEYHGSTLQEKRQNYSWLHFLKYSKVATVLLHLYAIGILMFVTAVPLSANGDGYLWTEAQNVAFFSLGRFGYCSSMVVFIFLIMIENSDLVFRLLGQSFWRPFAKLTFAAYLIYPIVINLGFNLSNDAIYLKYQTIIYYMFSNIVLTYLFALPLYLFIEAPIHNLIKLAIKRLSRAYSYSRAVQQSKTSQSKINYQNILTPIQVRRIQRRSCYFQRIWRTTSKINNLI